MIDWEHYAKINPLGKESYDAEPTQAARVEKILDRCVGSVLDVGGGDGYIAKRLMDRGHDVLMVDISNERVRRAVAAGVKAEQCEEDFVNVPNQSYDTVLLGEILEHMEMPGWMLDEAFRIARERVIVTVPLGGWCDPTHQWRISVDHIANPDPREDRPPVSEQIVMTWQRGECWPLGYFKTDEKWHAQFEEGH